MAVKLCVFLHIANSCTATDAILLVTKLDAWKTCCLYSILFQYYLSAPCAMHTRTDCPMQHYTEVKDWSDVRYNRNLSAVGGNQLWGTGQDKTQGTQAQPYKLGTLQESALPHLLYSLPYSPIAASSIQDQCQLPVISCIPELSLQLTHEPNPIMLYPIML